MTRKIMELSIAIFFLALSAVMAFTTVELTRLARTASDHYIAALETQSKQQNDLYNAVNDIQTLVTEGGFALSARQLEKQGLMSPADSNRMVREAIDRIKERSQRLGTLAESINEAYRNQ